MGSAADSIPLQAGGWSVTWQGTSTTNTDFPGATTIRDAFTEVVESAGGTLEYSPVGNYSSVPDAVVVVLSEQPYAEGNGDLQNLDWSASSVLQQVQTLRRRGRTCYHPSYERTPDVRKSGVESLGCVCSKLATRYRGKRNRGRVVYRLAG